LPTKKARKLFNFKRYRYAESFLTSILKTQGLLGLNFLWCDVMTGTEKKSSSAWHFTSFFQNKLGNNSNL